MYIVYHLWADKLVIREVVKVTDQRVYYADPRSTIGRDRYVAKTNVIGWFERKELAKAAIQGAEKEYDDRIERAKVNVAQAQRKLHVEKQLKISYIADQGIDP